MNTIEKMISMVDFDAFKESVKVTIGNEEKSKQIKDEYCLEYLRRWAKAKQDIFILFGEKFSLVKEIDISVSESEMDAMIKDLCKKYPQYAATIRQIKNQEYIKNEIKDCGDRILAHVSPKIFKPKAKASRVLSQIVGDGQFDIDLSKVLQNKTVKGQITLSIHPLDYVTMATNTHKWGSCMHIIDGHHKTGSHSLMLDENTIIGFSDNGRNETYENCGASFTWNNKVFRQLIILDKTRTAFVLGHYNGTVSGHAQETWINMMKDILPNGKNLSRVGTYGSCLQGGEFYYDTSFYQEWAEKDSRHEYKIGVKSMPCCCCGKELSDIMEYKDYLVCEGGCVK